MSVFVSLREPDEVRRDLLLASKSAISSLRRYEEYKKTRSEKLQAIHEFNADWHDLNKIMKKLKAAMPKDVHIPQKVVLPMPEKHAPKKQPEHKETVHKSKIDHLDSELQKIEQRLNSL